MAEQSATCLVKRLLVAPRIVFIRPQLHHPDTKFLFNDTAESVFPFSLARQ